MGLQDFKPDSEFGIQLKQQIATKFATLNAEDPSYVAEFLLVLISNNRSPSEIVEEFTSLFGEIINEQFVQEVIDEILRQQGELIQDFPPQLQLQAQAQSQSQSQPQLQPQLQSLFQPQHQENQQMNVDKEVRFQENAGDSFTSNVPRGPSASNRFKFGNQNGFKKNNAVRFKPKNDKFNNNNILNNNMSRMIEMSLQNNDPTITQIVPRKPTIRCQNFPHCTNKPCPNAHPTKICFAFPNCPNPPGTCTYLHPGEDDALIQEWEIIKATRQQNKTNNIIKNSGITLCKFGAVCQKELCPFGHPTPANRDAKVTLLQWCKENKECQNPNCFRAHSSPNYKPEKPHSAPGTGGNAPEKTLEQCKFGSYCKNYKCPKRHASTPVMCREGANCTRIDCYFQHPLNEECKFGINCKNSNCSYQHPEGRQIASSTVTGGNKVWVNGQSQDSGSTSQRAFAVTDDQVMEHAPIQEAT